jgi:aryl-alcohol dehydrogenase-like predicted oxidoreductase
MQESRIGEFDVPRIGFGAMRLSIEGRPDRTDAVRTIHEALDLGIRLIDTAEAYCQGPHEDGHNESLVAEALGSWGGDRDAVLVVTKGGHRRAADGGWPLGCRPDQLKEACERSLERLGVDSIAVYHLHRPAPDVPFAESVGALRDLRDEGKIRMVGISNVDVDQIEEARGIVDIAVVQNQFSPDFRSSEDELRLCEEAGIAFLAWSPLGAMAGAPELGSRHPAFAAIGAERGVSPQQVCLAWILATSPAAIPIPGGRRIASIADSFGALELDLGEDELTRLNEAVVEEPA